jgi:hypothetical protein
MLNNLIIRKLFTGLILLGFCLLYIFISALLMGWDILYFSFLILWGVPLVLIYAPIWSIFAEFIGRKYAKLPTNQKVLSLLTHILGGGLGCILIIAVTKPSELLNINISFLLDPITIMGYIFAFSFWLVDSMIVENISKKLKKT